MKKIVKAAAIALLVSAASVMANDFLGDLANTALRANKPSTLTQLENLWNPASGYETEAKKNLLDATGKKAEAEKHWATIAELEGKGKLKKKEKEQLNSAHSSINALIADAKTLEEGKEAEVGTALGYISLAITNYTLITAGGKDVVNSIKAKGTSPAIITETKTASKIVSAAPDRLSGSKELATAILDLMKTNNIEIPSAEKATEGVER